ncbi:antitoxin [Cellulomonas sp. JH27-2]|nr:antitoxin [Cellulomonas sp. JH27-2]
MTTLYIRDVADDVAQTLKERAAEAGTSLSAYVAVELAKLAARPTNAEVAARLRTQDRADGPSAEDIVAEVGAGRR